MALMPEELITVANARETVLHHVHPLGVERVPIDAGLDRVLAADLVATGDVPPFACSAMDGYALRAIDADAGRQLQIVGESRAGAPSDRELRDGEAMRISTGAALPPGADAVIPQENVDLDGDVVSLNSPITTGDNVRHAGEDMRAGVTALTAGTSLGVAELGIAVAAGAGELSVARRPRVAVICTGDELRAPGEPLRPGEIHNSNAPMLTALATRCGAITTPAERVGDDRAATERTLAAALDQADVLVITGGVSVGPHDHVKPALAALGVQEHFWRVALQPGKPTWFGTRDSKLVFGLPGNPVSAVVTFTLFARPALAALQGAAEERGPRTSAELGVAIARNPRRDQAVRVRLEYRDGATLAFPTGPQGSHIITSLLAADALAVVPAGDGELAAGTRVALETVPR
jgi:molybdopterin molybdotransferase